MSDEVHPTYLPGQTSLDQLEIEGLIAYIHDKKELDEAEARNILEARKWVYARQRKFSVNQVLTMTWITELHKQMFGEVWNWAGKFRSTMKNIGVPAYKISVELQSMLNDTKDRVENKVTWNFSNEEIAIHLAHTAVQIHPFANGNGRWSRELADAFLTAMGSPRLSWGSTLPPEIQHQKMIEAMKNGDDGNFETLMFFATH
jgi:Fic-DOC domain mobile mystery protein B